MLEKEYKDYKNEIHVSSQSYTTILSWDAPFEIFITSQGFVAKAAKLRLRRVSLLVSFVPSSKLAIFQSPPCSPQFGGWTNPSEKYAQVKLGIISPRFGVKIKNIWVATN